MSKKKVPVGTKFGRLTFLEDLGTEKGLRVWKCVCECGGEKIAKAGDIKSGKTSSCGCSKFGNKNAHQHGWSQTKIYSTWFSMDSRCNNILNKHYKDYGGRGIKVCDRWSKNQPNNQGLLNFIEDMYDKWFEGASIERDDVDGNYSPENCYWVDMKFQPRNIRIRLDNKMGFVGVYRRTQKDGRCGYISKWVDLNGKQRSKYFSIKKYGEELAELMAIEYREYQILLLNLQGAGYGKYHFNSENT